MEDCDFSIAHVCSMYYVHALGAVVFIEKKH